MNLFQVISRDSRANATEKPKAFLREDRWDDWGKYQTQFLLVVIDAQGEERRIGEVKIGRAGLLPGGGIADGVRAPAPPQSFNALGKTYFSLGQGEDYYAALNQLEDDLRIAILEGLSDCAFDLTIFEAHLNETVMHESLLRSVREDSVRSRLHRITQGDARLTNFAFHYFLPNQEPNPPAALAFNVVSEANPPTNVHVLIGRNGAGKSRCMRHMILTLLGRISAEEGYGVIHFDERPLEATNSFSSMVLVSFSAFDDFDITPQSGDKMPCHVVSLRKAGTQDSGPTTKSKSDLAYDFRNSLERCLNGPKLERWLDAVRTLETDDLFEEAQIPQLASGAEEKGWREQVQKHFERLSSGHSIVLLTITKLVELVDEKTLVFLDEPEGHLHPPLLSSFIRCLSHLLFKRNGVSIVATHSPVVLQEVPQNCAWKLRRSGRHSVVERPLVETFGENIGVLTRDVFGFEVTQAGFHTLLTSAVAEGLNADQLERHFGNQLGGEAQAIARALIANRDKGLQ